MHFEFPAINIFAGELTPSQFPVFTIYVQKNCLPSAAVCTAAWSFERVMDHQLASNPITRARRESRNDCMELCLTDDNCRYVKLLGRLDRLLLDRDERMGKISPIFNATLLLHHHLVRGYGSK